MLLYLQHTCSKNLHFDTWPSCDPISFCRYHRGWPISPCRSGHSLHVLWPNPIMVVGFFFPFDGCVLKVISRIYNIQWSHMLIYFCMNWKYNFIMLPIRLPRFLYYSHIICSALKLELSSFLFSRCCCFLNCRHVWIELSLLISIMLRVMDCIVSCSLIIFFWMLFTCTMRLWINETW